MAVIDVYDFDHTLFEGETSLAFFFYTLKKRPWILFFMPVLLLSGILLLLFPNDLTIGKRFFLLPLKWVGAFHMIPDFWKEMKLQGRLAPWFHPTENDVPVVICSASPGFLLSPLFVDDLAVAAVLATEVEPSGLHFLTPNTRGPEKVRRLKEAFPEAQIRIAASDSEGHDGPLLQLASVPLLVRHFERTPMERRKPNG